MRLRIEELKAIMLERGIRQKDICLITGRSKQTVSNWLSGRFDPSIEAVKILAKSLRVKITDLFI